MKKIFTLISLFVLALTAQAQTATDSYLDITKYASIDEAGIKGVLDGGHLYYYDETTQALVVSAFVGYQSSVNNDGAQAWITFNASGSSSVDAWEATDPFKGSDYYKMASSGAQTHRAAAINSSRTYKYRVSNCVKVSMLGATGGSNRDVTMTVYEVVDGVPAETATGSAAITVNAMTVASVDNLDKSKVYEIVFTNASSSNSRLFELAFYASEDEGGDEGGEEGGEEGGDDGALASYDNGTMVGTWSYVGTNAGDGSFEYVAKYNKNTTSVKTITFTKGATSGGAWQQAVKVEGEFLAGDKITIQPFTQMSASDYTGGSKYATILLYYEKMEEDVATPKQIADLTGSAAGALTVTDGHEEEGTPKTFEYTLEENYTNLFFARGGGTRINLMMVTITRTDPTGVEKVIYNYNAKTGVTYNLAGQKVGADYKGIVIKDGKKVIQ